MRNPNRLYEFYAELQRIHIKHFPDWRFGQFIINFFGAADCNPFFWEEDECLDRLRKFVGTGNIEQTTLSEAINKCNEQLEKHPKFDFSNVKVIKE